MCLDESRRRDDPDPSWAPPPAFPHTEVAPLGEAASPLSSFSHVVCGAREAVWVWRAVGVATDVDGPALLGQSFFVSAGAKTKKKEGAFTKSVKV